METGVGRKQILWFSFVEQDWEDLTGWVFFLRLFLDAGRNEMGIVWHPAVEHQWRAPAPLSQGDDHFVQVDFLCFVTLQALKYQII